MSNRPWSDESTVVPEVTDLVLYKKAAPSTVQNLATIQQLLSLGAYWDIGIINKSADESVASDTFIDIANLANTTLGQGVFIFELRLHVETTLTDGIQIRMQTTGATLHESWGRQSDDLKDNSISISEEYTFGSGTVGLLILQGAVEFSGTGPNTLKAQFAKLVVDTGTTSILKGSTFAIRQVA